MNAKDVIERLKLFNAWRRGADIEMPDPKAIGQDIDAAIKLLELMIELQKKFHLHQRQKGA